MREQIRVVVVTVNCLLNNNKEEKEKYNHTGKAGRHGRGERERFFEVIVVQ